MTREEAIKILEEIIDEGWLISDFEKCTAIDACEMAIKALEQEPRKGYWILTDVEGNRVWHCNCSECGKDPLNYIGGSENWWLIKSKLPKYCPNCGSRNEVEEC